MKAETNINNTVREKEDNVAAEVKVSPARILSFSFISVLWVMPVVISIYNSFKQSGKVSSDIFSLPSGESFVFLENYGNDFWKLPVLPVIYIHPVHKRSLYCTDPAVLLNGRLVYSPCGKPVFKSILRNVPVFACSPFPDGNVYAFFQCEPFRPGYALHDSSGISGIWCRYGDIYVCGIY